VAFPEYESTQALDELRATSTARLDEQQHTYLDYTGAGLHAASRKCGSTPSGWRRASSATRTRPAGVIGARPRRWKMRDAPCCAGSTRRATTSRCVSRKNASAALKLVGESYPFGEGGRLLLTADNHNSVNGVRRFGGRAGLRWSMPASRFPSSSRSWADVSARLASAPARLGRLFAFSRPVEFRRVVKHPLDLVDEAQALGWDVLLDAAAFVPANRLDLEAFRPDFVHRLLLQDDYGYRPASGALLARRDALARLERPWFAGAGTVNFATCMHARAHLLSPGEAGFEARTLNFLAHPRRDDRPAPSRACRHGFALPTRVRCLTGWLLQELMALRHANGRSLVRLYGPDHDHHARRRRDQNLYDPDGHLLTYRRIEELAGRDPDFSRLRTGCFLPIGHRRDRRAHPPKSDIQAAHRTLADDMSRPRFLQFITHRWRQERRRHPRFRGPRRARSPTCQRFVEFAASFCDQTLALDRRDVVRHRRPAASSATAAEFASRRSCVLDPITPEIAQVTALALLLRRPVLSLGACTAVTT
jgi:hypothetical protein